MENINIQNYNEERFQTAIALGNFDGVHLGHKKLILKMVETAKKLDIIPSVLFFNKHTKMTINGDSPMCLTSMEQKKILVKDLGVEIIYNIDFNEEIMKLYPEEFVKDILVEKLNTKLVVVGYDYKFGYKASGDVDTLKELSEKYDFRVIVLDPIYIDDVVISSTEIRKHILDGNLKLANDMLDRSYQIMGRVIPGNKIGRTIGFPTANMQLMANYIIPKNGVYRTNTIIRKSCFMSATSVGYNPTFRNKDIRIETHIIDFKEDIYDEIIYVDFIEYLRDEIKFDDVNSLINQIDDDIKTIISRH